MRTLVLAVMTFALLATAVAPAAAQRNVSRGATTPVKVFAEPG